MIISINLLPHEYIERKERQKKVVLGTAAGIAVLGVIILATLAGFIYKSSIEEDLAEVNSRLAELKPVVDNLKRVKQEREAFKKKIDLIESLLQGQGRWAKILDELSQKLTSGVYFNQMSYSGGILHIDGRVVATSDRQVEENLVNYLLSMSKSQIIKDYNFTMRKTKGADRNVEVAFSLDCVI